MELHIVLLLHFFRILLEISFMESIEHFYRISQIFQIIQGLFKLKISNEPRNTFFTSCSKVTGALDKPKAITSRCHHSTVILSEVLRVINGYSSQWVINYGQALVVFLSSFNLLKLTQNLLDNLSLLLTRHERAKDYRETQLFSGFTLFE